MIKKWVSQIGYHTNDTINLLNDVDHKRFIANDNDKAGVAETMKKIAILIPTYNRRRHLDGNCTKLVEIIERNNLQNRTLLMISNNNSTDDTAIYLNSLEQTCISKSIDLKVFHQDSNMGSVRNVLFLIHHCTAEFVLFLGDDDYLEEKYLLEVLFQLEINKNLACVVPAYINITDEGSPNGFGRDIHLPRKTYTKGFDSCLENAWRGHQLSGLVFLQAPISAAIERFDVDNMYLFIFIVGFSSYLGELLHLTDYPVLVTAPAQSNKAWSYGDDGLFSEIFDNFKRLPKLTALQRTKLELKIFDEQYWRYMMYFKKGPLAFVRALYKMNFGPNTSLLTSFLFPVLIFYFMGKRVLILALQGDLMKTLKRPVDI